MTRGPMDEAWRRWWRDDLWAYGSGFVTGLMLLLMLWMMTVLTLIDEKLSAPPGQPACEVVPRKPGG